MIGKVSKPFFKTQHQNAFDKIFATARTEILLLSVAPVIREKTD